MEEELYYIRHKGFVGNSILWWGKGGRGYTCDLNKAWRVTRQEAESICRDRPEEDSMYPVAHMDAIAQRHVDMQDLPLAPTSPMTKKAPLAKTAKDPKAEQRFRARYEADKCDDMTDDQWGEWVDALPKDEFWAMMELGLSDGPVRDRDSA